MVGFMPSSRASQDRPTGPLRAVVASTVASVRVRSAPARVGRILRARRPTAVRSRAAVSVLARASTSPGATTGIPFPAGPAAPVTGSPFIGTYLLYSKDFSG